MEIKDRIKNTPMGRFQVMVVAVCLALVVIDGIDISVMALSAPHIQTDWGTSKSVIGYLLASSLLGMAIGSFLLSPLADRFGRRKVLLTGVSIAFVGTFASIFVQNVEQLFAARLITGFGIGCMIAVIGVMLNEFASAKRYGFIMGFYAAGIAIGGMLGGFLAGPLISEFDWRAAFVLATGLTGVVAAAAYAWLPESVDYLIDSKNLAGLNKVLAKMNYEQLTELPVQSHQVVEKASVRAIFGRKMIARTMLLMTGYGFLVVSIYFLANWNPTLLSDATGDDDKGGIATVLWNFGGMAGCLAFGFLATWFKARILNIACLLAAGVSVLIYGAGLDTYSIAVAMILLAGFLANAGIAGFYSIIPPLFPSHARATGYGVIIGCGRLLAVAAPVTGGMLLDNGWSGAAAITLFAVPFFIAGIACIFLEIGIRKETKADLKAVREAVPVS